MAKQKKRKDGRIQKVFRINGKAYCVCGRTAAELAEKEMKKRQEVLNGLERRENPTLNEFYESWTETRFGSIAESTLHSQKSQYKVCAEILINGKALGDMKLSEIITDDIRAVQKGLQDGKRKTQSINDAIAHLSHVFHIALQERRIEYNPCTLVKPLKRTETPARDCVHRALTDEEIERFFAEAEERNSFYLNVYKMALLTGMRIGEIGALTPADIKDGKIYIEKTITRTLSGAYEIGKVTKTNAGKRTIPMNDAIKEVISAQKRLNKIMDGEIVAMDKPIFLAPKRGLLMSTPVNREITRICN